MELVARTRFDLAILDMNLSGERINGVAGEIAGQGIPIIFVTGYGQRTLPPGITAPMIEKPYTAAKLRPILLGIVERHVRRAHQ